VLIPLFSQLDVPQDSDVVDYTLGYVHVQVEGKGGGGKIRGGREADEWLRGGGRKKGLGEEREVDEW
jgi:hypothetical protein